MQVNQISIRRGFTINLRNFESARLEVGMTAELGPEDDPIASIAVLTDMVKDELARQITTDFDQPPNPVESGE